MFLHNDEYDGRRVWRLEFVEYHAGTSYELLKDASVLYLAGGIAALQALN